MLLITQPVAHGKDLLRPFLGMPHRLSAASAVDRLTSASPGDLAGRQVPATVELGKVGFATQESLGHLDAAGAEELLQ